MKNLKNTLLIVLVTIFIFSCSTDKINDNDDSLTVESLLGAWQLVASSENGISSKLTACDLEDLIIFDKNKLMYVYNKNDSGTKCTIVTLKKDFTVRDNIIVEDDGTEITIQQVFTLEPSSLVLKFEETYDDKIVTHKETYVKRQ